MERNNIVQFTDEDSMKLREEKILDKFFITESPVTSTEYDVHLYGAIGDTKYYTDLIHLFRNSTKNDKINLHISSPGGLLQTTRVILNAMNNCASDINATITGTVASAATMIVLNCDSIVVEKHATMMFHNYSGGALGKGQEITQRIESSNTVFKYLADEYYSGFLSEDEITRMLDGADIYIHGNDILTRMMNRKKYLDELKEKAQKEQEEVEAKVTKKKKKKVLKRKKEIVNDMTIKEIISMIIGIIVVLLLVALFLGIAFSPWIVYASTDQWPYLLGFVISLPVAFVVTITIGGILGLLTLGFLESFNRMGK